MNTTSLCSGNHILVGLGGTGGKILRAFKMRLFEEFPAQEDRVKQPVALLYVDSTEEMMPQDGRARPDFRVMGQDASFTRNEFLNIKAVDVEQILDHINNYPSVKGIVDKVSAVKSAIGSLGQAAGQKRRAGRLLFAANAIGFVNSLKDAYARCEKVSGDAGKVNIYIFAGLSGGTGSGAIVDAIIQSRKTFPEAKISAFAMMPEMNLPKSDMDQGRYYQNGYAAMNELNALQSGRWNPQDVTGIGKAQLYNDRVKGVADGLTIYSNVNENGLTINSLQELPKIVSDYIFARVFYINEEDQVNSDIIRAYNFENMDDFALEYDEAANPDNNGRIPVARTKKINSFGIKRVMYPELRVLKHITYTVGESILYQFKYNNWRENQGFVNEERNKDYRKEYLNSDNLQKWALDLSHLTYDLKVLESDSDYPRFNEYWHDKAVGYTQEAKKADNPLNELDNIMSEFYAHHFREEGVEEFFIGKERAIPEIAREIRHRVETELFEKWKIGDVSIVELQKVSKLLLEKATEIRSDLETKTKEEKDNYDAIDDDRTANVSEWSRLGILQRMVGIGARRYAEHQEILTDYYTSKTQLIALEFAKKLTSRVYVELGKMDADISSFGQKINDAIDETERLVTAQRKVNKGLEDMKGAIIEVSEDETMSEFEVDLKIDKVDMPNMARQIRESILPEGDFVNFGRLTSEISIDKIKDAFDIKLSEIVRTKHAEKADSDKKVLGLNILTQLQQKLKTDDDIKAFATKIVNQSGVYLKLNNDQIQLHLRNNEGNLSPTNPASINKKTILVSIPSPDDNEGLKRFADKLEDAFKNSFNQSTARTTIVVNRKSLRKDELSIITVAYCFPMRAIDWMKPYKERYNRFLHTGNPATDAANAILLHSEGDGSQHPSIFSVDNAEEIAVQAAQEAMASGVTTQPQSGPVVPPPMPGSESVLPPIAPQKEIKLFIAVAGQQYGPYNMDMCRQMVQGGQLTPQSMVWMEGMPAWSMASQVAVLQPLFAPPSQPAMPPLPPTGSPTPPPMM
ncbi:MAG: tubulin-like doman-containing protein [Bacteroidales bacterium]|nr:tubulin-like doman-containing protein [Bacteroidales bacterium]